MTKTTHNLFVFDTSAFVTLSRTDERVIAIAPAVWKHLEELMEKGVLISHELVFDEISSKGKNPDFIARWIAGKERYFIGRTQAQEEIVPKIIKKFPHLIDYESEKEQADPWLVALAVERSRDKMIFDETVAHVVSQENPASTKKIPAVCRDFGVEHLSLRNFFDKMGNGGDSSKKV